jgi:hypothetical protein
MTEAERTYQEKVDEINRLIWGKADPAYIQKKKAQLLGVVPDCPKGHPLTIDNLVPYQLKHGERRCLICTRAYARAWYIKKKATRSQILQ